MIPPVDRSILQHVRENKPLDKGEAKELGGRQSVTWLIRLEDGELYEVKVTYNPDAPTPEIHKKVEQMLDLIKMGDLARWVIASKGKEIKFGYSFSEGRTRLSLPGSDKRYEFQGGKIWISKEAEGVVQEDKLPEWVVESKEVMEAVRNAFKERGLLGKAKDFLLPEEEKYTGTDFFSIQPSKEPSPKTVKTYLEFQRILKEHDDELEWHGDQADTFSDTLYFLEDAYRKLLKKHPQEKADITAAYRDIRLKLRDVGPKELEEQLNKGIPEEEKQRPERIKAKGLDFSEKPERFQQLLQVAYKDADRINHNSSDENIRLFADHLRANFRPSEGLKRNLMSTNEMNALVSHLIEGEATKVKVRQALGICEEDDLLLSQDFLPENTLAAKAALCIEMFSRDEADDLIDTFNEPGFDCDAAKGELFVASEQGYSDQLAEMEEGDHYLFVIEATGDVFSVINTDDDRYTLIDPNGKIKYGKLKPDTNGEMNRDDLEVGVFRIVNLSKEELLKGIARFARTEMKHPILTVVKKIDISNKDDLEKSIERERGVDPAGFFPDVKQERLIAIQVSTEAYNLDQITTDQYIDIINDNRKRTEIHDVIRYFDRAITDLEKNNTLKHTLGILEEGDYVFLEEMSCEELIGNRVGEEVDIEVDSRESLENELNAINDGASFHFVFPHGRECVVTREKEGFVLFDPSKDFPYGEVKRKALVKRAIGSVRGDNWRPSDLTLGPCMVRFEEASSIAKHLRSYQKGAFTLNATLYTE